MNFKSSELVYKNKSSRTLFSDKYIRKVSSNRNLTRSLVVFWKVSRNFFLIDLHYYLRRESLYSLIFIINTISIKTHFTPWDCGEIKSLVTLIPLSLKPTYWVRSLLWKWSDIQSSQGYFEISQVIDGIRGYINHLQFNHFK